jgi:hypothetical protein
LVGITSILKEAWSTAAIAENEREKIQALSLAKDCYAMKLDLLTNATVVDDAIRFVSQKSQDKLKSTYSGLSDELSEVENKDEGLEEKQEEQALEIDAATTINQAF